MHGIKADNTRLKFTKRPRDGWSVLAVRTLWRNPMGRMLANVEEISCEASSCTRGCTEARTCESQDGEHAPFHDLFG